MDHAPEVLLQLFALLLAAKVGDEIFKRLDQPTLIGEESSPASASARRCWGYEVNEATGLFDEICLRLLPSGSASRLGWRTCCASDCRREPSALLARPSRKTIGRTESSAVMPDTPTLDLMER